MADTCQAATLAKHFYAPGAMSPYLLSGGGISDLLTLNRCRCHWLQCTRGAVLELSARLGCGAHRCADEHAILFKPLTLMRFAVSQSSTASHTSRFNFWRGWTPAAMPPWRSCSARACLPALAAERAQLLSAFLTRQVHACVAALHCHAPDGPVPQTARGGEGDRLYGCGGASGAHARRIPQLWFACSIAITND
jgi:hypothetical protein